MTTPIHDTQIDAWLRRTTVTSEAPPVTPACLDAETAAAWFDGGLDAVALEQVQAHVAGCVRCQALAGTIARVTVADARTPAPGGAQPWRRWFTWAMPLAGAAVAVVALAVWIRTPAPSSHAVGGAPAPASVTEASRRPALQADAREAPSGNAPAAAMPAPERRAAGQVSTPTSTPDPARRASASGATPYNLGSAREEQEPKVAADQAREAAADRAREAATGLARQSVTDPARQAATASSAASQAAPPVGALATAAPSGAATTPGLPPAGSPAAGSPAAPSSTTANTLPETPSTQPRADAKAGRPAATALRSAERSLASNWTLVTPPGASTRWRFLGTEVQRSTDAGASWNAVTVGVSGQILAGAAPSASVCWLVGRSGVVLLTTDGATWTRVASPNASDLASVVAANARAATVATADGLQFVTSDGGQSWTRR